MPVKVRWEDDTHRCIRYDISGIWTWDELYAAVDEVNAMLDTLDYPVLFITNMGEAVSSPPGLAVQIRNFMKLRHRNAGATVLVIRNPFWITLYDVISRVNPTLREQYRVVRTVDEAYAVIEQWQAGV